MSNSPNRNVLVIEDDPAIVKLLTTFLQSNGFECRSESYFDAAEQALGDGGYSVVLCDLWLGEINALDLVRNHIQSRPDIPIVLMSGQGDMESTIEVMRAGAYDFLGKPLDLGQVKNVVERALETAAATPAPADGSKDRIPGGLIGRSPGMLKVFKEIARFAQTDAPVLIEGETGTGKEMAARSVHLYSPASGNPFVAINCATLPETLMESELFGHVKGAFTGAAADREGLLRQANGGTVFLDEIGELDPRLQAKLLRVLQEKKIRPVGGTKEVDVNVRILSATHQPLEEFIENGRFRKDLFFRISTLRLTLPPLRDRAQDIALLARSRLSSASARANRNLAMTADAVSLLEAQPWPGNVRELFNTIDRAVALSPSGRITTDDFGWLKGAGVPTAKRDATLADVEKEHILATFARTGENVKETARRLDIDPKTLRRKLKAYGREPSADSH